MKYLIKKLLLMPSQLAVSLIFLYEKVISFFVPEFGGKARQVLISRINEDVEYINHQNAKISFGVYTPNHVCDWRWRTFSTKEPEILEWIDEYGDEGAFLMLGRILVFIPYIMRW